jgi:Peptidase family M1 domain
MLYLFYWANDSGVRRCCLMRNTVIQSIRFALRMWSLTSLHINGSVTSSPWRGGILCGMLFTITTEIRLNEGFATWVGWLAVDHLYPAWDIWSKFTSESLQSALTMDSLKGSHAIEVEVNDALEIDQIFDAISYMKGSSCIRMLSNHLGVETFLKGVSDYLKKHAYGNATTEDLWNALSRASGVGVRDNMDLWIKDVGYPVLTVAEEMDGIGIEQSRFLSTGSPCIVSADPRRRYGSGPEALVGTTRSQDGEDFHSSTNQCPG